MADRLLERRGRSPASGLEADPSKGGDIYAWAMRQADLLRQGRFSEIDIVNVVDEIEDVGKSDLRAFGSSVEIVLTHVLKWDHQARKRSASWSNSIFNHRLAIERLLRDSPSLRSKRDLIIEDAYSCARRRAARDTKLDLSSFPIACPYSWPDIMETRYEMDDGQD